MKLLRFTVAATALPLLASIGNAQALNRINVNNGGDVIWNIQNPTPAIGDPANGVVTGDCYYSILPGGVATQADAAMDVAGFEYSIFDQDWVSSEEFWGWTISNTYVGTSGALRPDWLVEPTLNPVGQAPIVFVPDFAPTNLPFFGQPGGNDLANCPPPGYLSGYFVRDVLTDSTGGNFNLTANGTTDLAFTHIWPAGQDSTLPATNFCGGSGDKSFSWLNSNENSPNGAGFGENNYDVLGNAQATHAGWFAGGFGPQFEDYHAANEVAWLISDTATLNAYTDSGQGASPELGTAGYQTPLPFASGGGSLGTQTLGARIYDATSNGAGELGVCFGQLNSGPFQFPLGFFLPLGGGINLGLNPSNAAFLGIANGVGLMLPANETGGTTNFGLAYGGNAFGGDRVYDGTTGGTGQVNLAAVGAGGVGLGLRLQAFIILGGAAAENTQTWDTVFGFADTVL